MRWRTSVLLLVIVPTAVFAEPRAIRCSGKIQVTVTQSDGGKVVSNEGGRFEETYVFDDANKSFVWFVPERNDPTLGISKQALWDVCFGYSSCEKKWDSNNIFIQMRGGEDNKREWLSLDRVSGKMEGAADWHNQDPPGIPPDLASAPSETHHSYDLECTPTIMPELKQYRTKF